MSMKKSKSSEVPRMTEERLPQEKKTEIPKGSDFTSVLLSSSLPPVKAFSAMV